MRDGTPFNITIGGVFGNFFSLSMVIMEATLQNMPSSTPFNVPIVILNCLSNTKYLSIKENSFVVRLKICVNHWKRLGTP